MISIQDFKNLDIRIAEILEAIPHPNADRLYVLKIKIGEETRQIVAGIRLSYPADKLPGRKIVVVTNLEPAVIRGVESNGMLLAASDGSGRVILLAPEQDISSGAKVS